MDAKPVTTWDIENAVSRHFDTRRHLIVPNISWGMNLQECDLLVLSDSGYACEVEIKISKADLKRDAFKLHQHKSNRIRRLWFAMPDAMRECSELVPVHAGILIVTANETGTWHYVEKLRPATNNPLARPWTQQERYDLARLGLLRYWTIRHNTTNGSRVSEVDTELHDMGMVAAES